MPRHARLPALQSPPPTSTGPRRLCVEPLEDRRLLAVLTVNSLADDTVAGNGLVTLREAVTAANDDAATDLGQTGLGADQIVFHPDLFTAGPQTATLTSGAVTIASDLEILGPGASLLSISGNDASRIFTIDDGDGGQTNAAVRLADLTLTGGLASGADDAGRGGAVFSVESLTVERVVIQDNVAGNDGGGLLASVADGGQIVIRDSTITGNLSAAGSGGGLSIQVLYGGYASLANLVVDDNDANVAGGGVALGAAYYGAVYLSDSLVTSNTAEFGGGVLMDAIEEGAIVVERTTITGNASLGDEESYDLLGGGLSVFTSYLGTATLFQSTISGNAGGGIAAVNGYGGTLYLLETDIRNNLGIGPNNYGGAGMQVVADELSVTELVRSQISGHASRGEPSALGVLGGSGGGLYLYGYQTTTIIRDSTIANNQSTGSGGGLYLAGYASGVEITGSTISGNQADLSGGGLYLYHDLSSAVRLAHSTITGNQADQANTSLAFGGGLSSYGATAELDHTILAGNTSLSGLGPDLYGPAAVAYTLLGNDSDAWLTIVGSGNQIGTAASPIDPLLRPLANNGGPTSTHALAVNSPAVDQGDAALATPPDFDQRGFPYQRVVGAAIDLGAYELQVEPADANNDLLVTGGDFLLWQRGFGIETNATRSDGDADGDGDVDQLDLLAWEATFGVGVAPVGVQLAVGLGIPPVDSDDQAEALIAESLPSVAVEMLPARSARDSALEQWGIAESQDEGDIVVRRRSATSTPQRLWRGL